MANSKKETTTTTKKSRNSSNANEQLIYCGPNLPKGILNRFTVFRNGFPKYLEKHFEKCDSIKKLCVPVDQTGKVIQSIDKRGTAENLWFTKINEFIKEGVE